MSVDSDATRAPPPPRAPALGNAAPLNERCLRAYALCTPMHNYQQPPGPSRRPVPSSVGARLPPALSAAGGPWRPGLPLGPHSRWLAGRRGAGASRARPAPAPGRSFAKNTCCLPTDCSPPLPRLPRARAAPPRAAPPRAALRFWRGPHGGGSPPPPLPLQARVETRHAAP
ncbi:MAG: hypothetical protein J3K34DRAFT_400741 [Monoraphidium minutum]|nr:MAG: hypothetical protein J3K34DRAFT_400741 [Monoraphidium minutum]